MSTTDAAAPGPDALAPVADGRFHPLDPRFVAWRRRRGGIRTAFLSFVLVVAAGLGAAALETSIVMALAAWLALTIALAWQGHVWPRLAYRWASYRVTDQGVDIRRGVLVRRMIHVPRSRVQHTDVSQGPMERSFGLGTLTIYTAGTNFAQVELPGLAHEHALRIRAFLIRGAAGDDV